VRSLQNFVFAVEAKVHKRVLVKWRELVGLERKFDSIDAAWHNKQFFVYKGFRFPDE
jgi:hypothetical protein